MVKQLIINADDFGYNDEITSGIIETIEFGLVKNTTLMLNKPGTARALEYLKNQKERKVNCGLHLNLDSFFNIEHGVGRIIGYKNPSVSAEEIEKAIRKEIESFKKTGLELTHIDSHHHTHMLPGILPILINLCREYNIKTMRFSKDIFIRFWNSDPEHMRKKIIESGIQIADNVIDGWFWGNLDLWHTGSAEIISHPGYGSELREKEKRVLTDRILSDYIGKSGMEVISYRDLKN